MRYLRYEDFFILAATEGRHAFYRNEVSIKHVAKYPIYFRGYSIGYRGGHASVRIEDREFLGLKSYYVDQALRHPAEWFEDEFRHLPYEPFAPIHSQLLIIFRAVNEARSIAGLYPVPNGCFRFKRRVYRPFEPIGEFGTPYQQRGIAS